MKSSTSKLILIITILALSNSGIYFVTAYSQMQESSDASSQIQTMLFATAAISYIPLGMWMIKNNLHSRAPYVITSLVSIALIGLYVASRTISLPIVGIQEDVGIIDILCQDYPGLNSRDYLYCFTKLEEGKDIHTTIKSSHFSENFSQSLCIFLIHGKFFNFTEHLAISELYFNA